MCLSYHMWIDNAVQDYSLTALTLCHSERTVRWLTNLAVQVSFLSIQCKSVTCSYSLHHLSLPVDMLHLKLAYLWHVYIHRMALNDCLQTKWFTFFFLWQSEHAMSIYWVYKSIQLEVVCTLEVSVLTVLNDLIDMYHVSLHIPFKVNAHVHVLHIFGYWIPQLHWSVVDIVYWPDHQRKCPCTVV